MARMVVLVFDDEESAEQFAADMQEGSIKVWTRERQGFTITAGVLAILKPSTLSKGFSHELPVGEDGVFRG